MSLNTQEISEDNYRRLEEYVAQVKAAGLKFPGHGGKVNKTAVANACGFNRETFQQNARFDECLQAAVKDIGIEERTATTKAPRDSGDKSRITLLEQQLTAVRSENLELRRKLARYEHATLTGRRVIP